MVKRHRDGERPRWGGETERSRLGEIQRVGETEGSWEWSGPGRHKEKETEREGRGGARRRREREGTSRMERREEIGWGRVSGDWARAQTRERGQWVGRRTPTN